MSSTAATCRCSLTRNVVIDVIRAAAKAVQDSHGSSVKQIGHMPTQVETRLEWGCSAILNSVIPTGANHLKAMICGVEGPAVAALRGYERRHEIESAWTSQMRAGECKGCLGTSCKACHGPEQKTGLEWGLRPWQ